MNTSLAIVIIFLVIVFLIGQLFLIRHLDILTKNMYKKIKEKNDR